jgi:pimeloyl-ACP methyl ester carboxylesterase
MVALEALASVEVPHDKVLGLVILSGCRSRRAITQEFKKNVTLMHLAPKPLLRSQLRRIARTFSPNDPLTDEQRDLLVEMADEIDLDLLRWGAAACAKWDYEGPEKTGFPFPVYQIHGSEDDVIPLVEGDPDFVIPGGGHMIQYAHSAEINRLIELRRDAWLAERSGS